MSCIPSHGCQKKACWRSVPAAPTTPNHANPAIAPATIVTAGGLLNHWVATKAELATTHQKGSEVSGPL